MAHDESVGEDRYLAPGTRVRRDVFVNDYDYTTSEFGVLVHCWLDNEIGNSNCLIAFFSDAFPGSKPDEKSYVLRYAAAGLAELAA
jgi:hypothetical protein